MRVYNMDKGEWKEGDFKTGQIWRSDVAYKCEICHALTNKWFNFGRPIGAAIECPGNIYFEHEVLKDAERRYSELKRRIGRYKKLTKLTGKRAPAPGEKECKLLLQQITALRSMFNCDDVVGKVKRTELRHLSCESEPEKHLIEG